MLPPWFIPLAIMLATILAMEVLAALLHRYVMHGWGWGWHRSHHQPRAGRLELNDLYALVFAAAALPFFTFLAQLWPLLWWVGAGMAAYGLLYAFVHDGLVHRRFAFVPAPRRGYLKRLVQAHRLHHAVKERDGAVSFGFLYAPPVGRLARRLKQGEQAR